MVFSLAAQGENVVVRFWSLAEQILEAVGRNDTSVAIVHIAGAMLSILLAYLLGSINPAVLISRVFYKDDIRLCIAARANACKKGLLILRLLYVMNLKLSLIIDLGVLRKHSSYRVDSKLAGTFADNYIEVELYYRGNVRNVIGIFETTDVGITAGCKHSRAKDDA